MQCRINVSINNVKLDTKQEKTNDTSANQYQRFGKKPDPRSTLKPCFCPQKPGAKRKKHPKLKRLSHKNKHLPGSDPAIPL